MEHQDAFQGLVGLMTSYILIHCDSDFQPLTPVKIVKQFVKILSKDNSFEALNVLKDSHESEPIQITDILCGCNFTQHCLILHKK